MKTKEELKREIFAKLTAYYKIFLSGKPRSIPVSGKKFDAKEIVSIVDAALDCWWTEGDVTEKFEKKFNDFFGVKETIVVNSGSSANLLALKTLCSAKLGEKKLNQGDEIITVAAGFPTTINPIIECGCVPVFCDIDIPCYNINVSQMKKALSKKTKAVFLAHTLGNPFDVKAVTRFCRDNNLWMIEDNCDSLGSRYNDRLTGTFGDLSTHSFYPAHLITMGEGGAVCTSNAKLATIARSIKDWGRDCWCKTGHDNTCKKRFDWKLGNLPHGYDHKYIYSEIGYNLKNTDLNVAIGLSQMEKINSFIEIRKRNFRLLRDRLVRHGRHFIFPEATANSDPCWFGFLLTIKENAAFSRRELLKCLDSHGVGTRLLFGGNITKQPYFIDNKINYRIVDNLKNTDFVMNNSFWIGVCPLIGEQEIDAMAICLDDFVKKF